jgi:hypothetical protein
MSVVAQSRTARRAVAVTALAAASTIGIVAHQDRSAHADSVDSTVAVTCAVGGSHIDVDVPMTVQDTDPVPDGGTETLVTKPGLPSLPVEVTINKVVITGPIPSQVASTDSVTFTGGNVTGAYQLDGSNLIITFTGPMSSKDIQIPAITTTSTIRSGIAPTTIPWLTFSTLTSDTNLGTATCTPKDPGQVLNTTTVSDGSTTTTAPTTAPVTTTAPSGPTTTEPPVTTPVTTPGSSTTTTTSAPPPPMTATTVPVPPGLPGVPGVPTPPVTVPGGVPTPPATLPGGVPAPPTTLPGLPTPPVPPPSPPVPSVAVPSVTIPTVPIPPLPAPGVSVKVGINAKVGL